MPKLTVDGIEVEVPAGATVLQACEAAGKEIPRFCYHERLTIAGNCRMCLVEVSPGPPKPQASCALPAMDNQVITTTSAKVKKAREGVMEFLLINHPLDCPVCDQGGECDLQDQSMAYGRTGSRFEENKRAVVDKYMGPLIKTVMTRCIHCTRCVRFAEEVAGVEEIGAVGRGENMQITSYLERAVTSELSGNVIDLCPVGALTSKPYAFEARPWELTRTQSIDVMDAVGSAIRIDARGNAVLRILPRLNEAVNEEWLSDKGRFACDGLGQNRLDQPYIRRDGVLQPASWPEAFAAIKAALQGVRPEQCAALAGDLQDVEGLYALKALLGPGAHLECRLDGAALDPSVRAGYVLNSTIAGLETADLILLVGTNPRWEAPLVNTRLRKAVRRGGARVVNIGPVVDLTYPVEQLGDDASVLKSIASGAHPLAERLRAAQRPALILGQGALARSDGGHILAAARSVADKFGLVRGDWNGFNVLHTAAGRVGALDLGYASAGGVLAVAAQARAGAIKVVFAAGVDEMDLAALAPAFLVYAGSHGDRGAPHADVILPSAAYSEKSATYVNTEGRVQRTERAIFPPGDAREDWTIWRALSDVLGQTLPFDTLDQLRAQMALQVPLFAQPGLTRAPWGVFGQSGDISPGPIALALTNFYQSNPIARASATMADCQAVAMGEDVRATGTNG